METTESESPSPALTPLPSLEHLLTSPDPKQGMFERKVHLGESYSVYKSTMYSTLTCQSLTQTWQLKTTGGYSSC